MPGQEAREAATKAAQALLLWNGQGIRDRAPDMVIRTDASHTGLGAVVIWLAADGEVQRRLELCGSLPPDVTGESASIVREALALETACRMVADWIATGSVVVAVVDNRGLACRHWIGTRSAAANEILTRLALGLAERGAVLRRVMWTPRANLEREDHLSRMQVGRDANDGVHVHSAWWKKFMGAACPAPNVDATARAEDHRLERYAAIDGSGQLFDGLAVRWRGTDVPWFFPLLGVVVAAMRNWLRSESLTSDWCLPAFRHAPWCTLLGIGKESMNAESLPDKDSWERCALGTCRARVANGSLVESSHETYENGLRNFTNWALARRAELPALGSQEEMRLVW